jgi:hypothetical protein
MSIKNKFRAIKEVIFVNLRRNNISRWKRVASSGAQVWDERNKFIASLIPPGSRVLDLGSGPQTLRTYLRSPAEYQPCDLVPAPGGVIIHDFNGEARLQLEKYYDYAVFSGVLEYLNQPHDALAEVGARCDKIIASYNVYKSEDSILGRQSKGWRNHMTFEELTSGFQNAGFQYAIRENSSPRELIFELSKISSIRKNLAPAK